MTKPEELVSAARDAMARSYSPYSHFTVGAAAVCRGKIYVGANVENASYGATVCAERNAIFAAVTDNMPQVKSSQKMRGGKLVEAIAIAGGFDGKVSEPAYPCGICRQVMAEFCAPDTPVYIAAADGFETYTLAELLPKAFDL